jgi:hypothetical protein
MIVQNEEDRIELSEIKLEPIELCPGMKGICVVAIPTKDAFTYDSTKSAWVILIKNVKAERDTFHIIRHVSYSIGENQFYCDCIEGAGWGTSRGYDFYLATKDMKKKLAKMMRVKKMKYISILNKLIKFE